MRSNRGFTFIELMAVCAVVAILVGVAAPSLNHFVQTNRLSNETNSLVSALNLARSEAINLRSPVTVCASNTAGDDCGANNDFSNGLLVQSADGLIVKTQKPLDVFSFGVSGASTASAVVVFDSRGYVTASNSIGLCVDGDTDLAREIDISPVGRVMAREVNVCP